MWWPRGVPQGWGARRVGLWWPRHQGVSFSVSVNGITGPDIRVGSGVAGSVAAAVDCKGTSVSPEPRQSLFLHRWSVEIRLNQYQPRLDQQNHGLWGTVRSDILGLKWLLRPLSIFPSFPIYFKNKPWSSEHNQVWFCALELKRAEVTYFSRHRNTDSEWNRNNVEVNRK